ncbi:MAG: NAD(P)H-dependent oxidoreductase, partial [Planctomycetaceae bacterium]|nr:NAD(P)H-dependent oxidoreductase [Planctomycetaceae bacterium]
MYLIIACSQREQSRSRILAEAAQLAIQSQGREVELIQLKDYPLPLCDGESAYSDPNVAILAKKILQAEGVLFACPIYNYSINSAMKNLIELTGRNLQEKVVGFLCAAGGANSYMSIMGIANSLML